MFGQEKNRIASFVKLHFGSVRPPSLQQLLTAFSNHLYLGQWELAKACLLSLRDYKETLDIDIKDVLLNVAQNPKNYSLGSESINSPHLLSWLCLEELKEYMKDEELSKLKKDIEFRLLLFEASQYTNKDIIQELYEFRIQTLQGSSEAPIKKKLSDGNFRFLQTLLVKNAPLAKVIILNLLEDCNLESRTVETLGNLFIISIEHYLKSLLKKSKLENFHREEIIQDIYQIYSLLSAMVINVNKCQSSLKFLFKDIFVLLHDYKHMNLNQGIVYLTLLRSENNDLIKKICDFEDDYFQRDFLKKTSFFIPEPSTAFNYNEAFVKAITNIEREVAWKELCLQAVKNDVHFLQTLIDYAVYLVKECKFTELENLLQASAFHPLNGLLLLVCWSHVHSLNNAQQLLNLLGSSQQLCDPLLKQSCEKLSYQMELVQWCLDQTASLLEASGAPEHHHHRISEMFQNLESHSALYMLNHCTKLSTLNECEVFNLLKKTPVPTGIIPLVKKEKSVHFASEEQGTLDVEFQGISLDQERDCIIFQSYQILKLAMDAIYASVCLDTNLEMEQKMKNKRSSSLDMSASDDILNENYEQETLHSYAEYKENYHQLVIKRLDSAREHLKGIFPLTYRVEILQNLFSLLFVQSSDIQENEQLINSDSDAGSHHDEYSIDKLNDETSLDISLSIEAGTNDSTIIQKDATGEVESEPKRFETVKPSLSLFKISKTILRDSSENTDVKSSWYDYTSSLSTCSSGGILKIGFLCSDYIVRDILYFLKNSLIDLNSVYFSNPFYVELESKSPQKTFNNESQAYNMGLQESINSSISQKHLRQCITQLTQHISEAQWRFQLVVRKYIPDKYGEISLNMSQILDIDLASRIRFGDHYQRKYSLNVERLDDRVKRKKRHRRKRQRTNSLLKEQPSGIINCMLGSHETLLNLCLKWGNLVQASQVVKIFNMESTTTNVLEVKFSEFLKNARKKLQTTEERSRSMPLTPSTIDVSQEFSPGLMNTLADAAAAGKVSSSLTLIVTDLLKSCRPKLPIHKIASLPLQLLHLFNEKNIPAMVVFDLAVSSCRSLYISTNLLGIVLKWTITSNSGEDSNQIVVENSGNIYEMIKGFDTFSKQLLSILQSIKDNKLGILPLLLASNNSLDIKKRKQMATSFQELIKMATQLHKQLENVKDPKVISVVNSGMTSESENQIYHHNSQKSSSKRKKSQTDTKKDEDKKSLFSKDSLQSSVHTSMKQLVNIFKNYIPEKGILSLLLQNKKTDSSFIYTNYISSLYEHVQLFAKIILESELENLGVTQDSLSQNNFFIFKEGPLSTLGKLMFNTNIDPLRLKSMSEELHLDFVQVIMYYCCPVIPTISKSVDTIVRASPLILNYGNCQYAPRKPQVIVQDLLKQLIESMQDFSFKTQQGNSEDVNFESSSKDMSTVVFTLDAAELFLQSDNWMELIQSTGELKQADLKQLDSEEEKLSFYINLLNLMWFHSFLNEMTSLQKRFHRKSISHSISISNSSDCFYIPLHQCWQSIFEKSTLDILFFLKKRCYQVGQLGIVSLFDLHFYILRIGFQPPAFQSDIFFQECFDLSQFDPWINYIPLIDPRVIFTINIGCLSSPPLQIYKAETVIQDLNEAVMNYISINTSVKNSSSEIFIPQLLSWYYQLAHCVQSSYGEFYDKLASFVACRSSHQLQAELLDFFNFTQEDHKDLPVFTAEKKKDFVVKIVSFNFHFGYTFSHLPLNEQKSSEHNEQHSPANNILSFIYKVPSTIQDIPSKAKLNLSLMKYLENENTLYANLACIMIFQEEVYDGFTVVEHPWTCEASLNEQKLSIFFQFVKKYSLSGFVFRHLISSDICPRNLLGYVLALSSYQGENMDNCMKEFMNQLIIMEMWQELLYLFEILESLRRIDLSNFLEYKDFILCKMASLKDSGSELEKPWVYARMIKNTETKARCVLQNLEQWPTDECIQTLEMCLSSNLEKKYLANSLESALKLIKLYQRVIICLKKSLLSLQDKFDISLENDALPSVFQNWNSENWTNIVKLSKRQPNDVLQKILECHEYNLAHEWGELFNIGDQKKWEIEESYFIYLLESSHSDKAKAYQVLEALLVKDKKLTLQTCGCLLQKLSSHSHILFVAQFALDYLITELTEENEDTFRLKYIGAKALLCLPAEVQVFYQHLAERPILLLEQLLMNMKVDWADTVFHSIENDSKLLHNKELGVTVESFDLLLVNYANFALDCPASKAVHTETSYRLSSLSRGILSSSLSTSTTIGSIPIPLSSSPLLNRNVTSLSSELMKFEDKNKPLGISPVFINSVGKRNIYSTRIAITSTAMSSGLFIMPTHVPSKADWVPDSEVSFCMVCKIEHFSMFNRRHHCRRCGRVVCSGCSRKTARFQPYGEVPVRICDECSEQMIYPESWTTGSLAGTSDIQEQRIRARLPGSSPRSLPVSNVANVFYDEEFVEPREQNSYKKFWRLDINNLNNTTVRGEFFYEQAPSISLCLSIVNFHSNLIQCGNHMLKFCDDLSTFLKPVAPGMANPEVDYSLVISMIRTLLFNAKLKFIKANDTKAVGLCDTYMSRVDLLNLLVSHNCKDIPSIHELTQMEAVRRLQNRLIEDERMSLAMELSTKCGLDVNGVWSAWGMTFLRNGDFTSAREKFSHCLKPPFDRNQGPCSKTLEDIIDYLEKPLPKIPGKLPLSVKDPITDVFNLYPTETHIDERNFLECSYYLQTYGTHLSLVIFYRKHQLLQTASQYILDKSCAAEVFIEGLFLPSLKYAEISKLEDQIIMIDPTLNKWGPYLMATCRYLQRKHMLNVLYKLQVFIKDHIRAAMTCIKFFLKNSQTYEDLFNHLSYLHTAKNHLQDYLHNCSSLEDSPMRFSDLSISAFAFNPKGTDSNSLRLSLSKSKVVRHISTIDYQIEVTNFMHKFLSTNKSNTHIETAITLFSDFNDKSELTSHVILVNLEEGFHLGFKIIQDFHLKAVQIFIQVIRDLAHHNKHKDIKYFLQQIKEAGPYTDQNYDEVVEACVQTLVADSSDSKEIESYIKMLKSDAIRIDCYILSGKLKSAYLMAVRENRASDIQRISLVAQQAGQIAVKNICDKWLAANEKRLEHLPSKKQ